MCSKDEGAHKRAFGAGFSRKLKTNPSSILREDVLICPSTSEIRNLQ